MQLAQYIERDAPELARLYASINFSIDHKEDRILAERVGDKIRLKTFSNMGHKDVSTGDDLRAFLTDQNIDFESPQPRTVIIKETDFQKLFGEDLEYEPTDAEFTRMKLYMGLTNVMVPTDDILIEPAVDGELYMKTMSNGGVNDDKLGKIIQDYLTGHGVKFNSDRLRSLTMAASDFKRLFGNNNIVASFHPTQLDVNFKRLVECVNSLGLDFSTPAELKNFYPLLDSLNPDAMQFYHDLLAAAETRERAKQTLARAVAKFNKD